jgi:hypothetical protein
MNNFTFLTEEQIFGNNQLDIIKKYGTKCSMTDFSVLLGCNGTDFDKTMDNLGAVGAWYTKSSVKSNDDDSDVLVVSEYGKPDKYDVRCNHIGARPVLTYSSIQSNVSKKVRGYGGIMEVEYGEYPQTIVDDNYSLILDEAYRNSALKITGKNYKIRKYVPSFGFNLESNVEYEYDGNRYIHLRGSLGCDSQCLSDGREIISDKKYWVRVEPIIWQVDEKADIAITKKIIFSGVTFQTKIGAYHTDDFDRSDIKQFMDNYFSKEIISDKVYYQTASVEQIQNIKEMVLRKQR